ncbi:MAG: cyclase [Phycisphaerae bacterium]|nr:MAG: cyclase [Phycisphaerae bacterium]
MKDTTISSSPNFRQPRFQLKRELVVPARLDDVFEFFSDAHNLDRITPNFLKFRVLTPAPIDMHVGTHINYALRMRGIPLRWTSEITSWEPPYRFVDSQIKGPYRSWVHEHRFESMGDATKVIDEVAYDFFGGHFVHAPFTKRDINRIFDHRTRSLRAIFCDGKSEASHATTSPIETETNPLPSKCNT